MGTFSSTLDTAAFIELGGDDSGTGAVFVAGTNVPDRPDGLTGITTITFLGPDGSVAGTAPVRQGGFFKAVLDGVDVVRWSVDGGTTVGGVLLSDEFRASMASLVDNISSATATMNTAAAQALQAVSDAADATQAANAAAQTAQTAAQLAQQASASSAYFTITMVSGSYPARGRTTGVCNWRGPTKPPITTGYAQAGDEWTRTAS